MTGLQNDRFLAAGTRQAGTQLDEDGQDAGQQLRLERLTGCPIKPAIAGIHASFFLPMVVNLFYMIQWITTQHSQ